ncbi:MAG TPA: glycosyltransferase [Solirubrobacteraceae bacterium]|nr:glycosyltransferase [Solirubrobacteraceae bacterium]
MTGAVPKVAITLPVYNSADTIRASIESALSQTYEDFELVITDNASTDDTVEVVRSYDDPRIRLHRNPVNVGYQANINGAIALCRSPFVKFLHGDDQIYPTCLERMLEVIETSERVGMVFCRRRIAVDADAEPDLHNFREVFETAYRNFGDLQPVNDGRTLLRRWVRAGLLENWIGEPSNVMMRLTALQQLGLFNTRMRMLDDFDMWARTMVHFDVGFVDEELATYRFHANNTTIRQTVAARWFDLLWLLEGLAAEPGLLREYPELRRAMAQERWRVVKHLVRTDRAHLKPRLRVVADYLRYRARRAAGRATTLHPPLRAA